MNRLRVLISTPEGRKMLRYSATSVLSVVVSVTFLVLFSGVLRWGPVLASTLATAIATVPSYQLNRRWAWGKSGRGHLWKEVVPFWVLAFLGWGFSTYSVKLAGKAIAGTGMSDLVHTGVLAVVYVAAFGVLWVVKFVVFNKVLFASRPEALPLALDGRTGVPG